MSILRYWRNSLSDAEILNPKLSKILNKAVQVPVSAMKTGIVPDNLTELLFKGVKKDKNQVDVLLCPKVLRLNTQHGKLEGNYSKELTPLWIPAQLDREGQLLPKNKGFPFIPRDFLEPNLSDADPVGELDTMDRFLSEHPYSKSAERWSDVWKYAQELFQFVAEASVDDYQHDLYTPTNESYIIQESLLQGSTKKIIELYDQIESKGYSGPLLQSFSASRGETHKIAIEGSESTALSSLHLGQMGFQFPLSPSQRTAVHHLSILKEGELLAVNGPPGTGKTTLLQSVVASMWVQAAIDRSEPPIIVASSANNQAVTNVIDSFGKLEEDGSTLASRWIPDVQSYGLYLVSSFAKGKDKDKFQSVVTGSKGSKPGFFDQMETESFVERAFVHYYDKYEEWAGQPAESLQEIIEGLHENLVDTVGKIQSAVECYTAYTKKQEEMLIKYPLGLEQQEQNLVRKIQEAVVRRDELAKVEAEWNIHRHKRYYRYLLFGWINAVSRNRDKYYQRFFLERWLDQVSDIENFVSGLQQDRMQLSRDKAMLNDQLDVLEKDRATLKEVASKWEETARELHLEGAEDPLNVLDVTLRYRAFQLAGRYWEGRWLQEVHLKLGDERLKDSSIPEKQLRLWKRYAKLTPCFVSTLYMTPSFFTAWQDVDKPLFEGIDLLIVDEAGQVSPEVAGASFALAKKALIVGDTLQIEPVWSIPPFIDAGNSEKYGLSDINDGYKASSGSVMLIAQDRSAYSHGNNPAGIMLTEHRRCVPEIIGFCNELAYRGRLEAKRVSLSQYDLPHIGYGHIPGKTSRSGGSLRNELEAQTIAKWIDENKHNIEGMYNSEESSGEKKTIEELVAVITPFNGQKSEIKKYMQHVGLGGITVGTVHALQGAERPIIIFSSVYDSSEPSGYFFDQGLNMLNVAVSRAKDSFLVFGDMGIFREQGTAPSNLLSKYLFKSDENEIKNIKLPQSFLDRFTEPLMHITKLDEHQRILRECIQQAHKELVIVSPFLSANAINMDELPKLLAEAVSKGVAVSVYTDEKLNSNWDRSLKPHYVRAKLLLEQSGVNILLTDRIHNKTLWMDRKLIVEGSFNWLSAVRKPTSQWCRYETSFVYRGEDVAQMIETVFTDLERKRTKKADRIDS